MNAAIAYEQHVEQKPMSDFKKIMIGYAYRFSVGLIFLLIGIACASIEWWLFFHVMGKSDHQLVYVYGPYEIKYVTVTILGIKQRVEVKRLCKRIKLVSH